VLDGAMVAAVVVGTLLVAVVGAVVPVGKVPG
jgi:hypothetical protein